MFDFIKYINADNLDVDGTGVRIGVMGTGYDLATGRLQNQESVAFGGNSSAQDTNGHETRVANIINDIAPGAELVHIKVTKVNTSNIYQSDVVNGINWSANNDIDILNMSFYAPNTTSGQPLVNAATNAISSGIELVTITGNADFNAIGWPADISGVHGVGAVGEDGLRPIFSQFGEYLDISAPGVGIQSESIGGQIMTTSGTSLAAPMISAAMALMISDGKDPNKLYDYVLPVPNQDAGVVNVGFALHDGNKPMLHAWVYNDHMTLSYLLPELSTEYDVSIWAVHEGGYSAELRDDGIWIPSNDYVREDSFHDYAANQEIVGNVYGAEGIYDQVDVSGIGDGEWTLYIETVAGLIGQETVIIG